MMSKVLLTGASGFLGSEIYHAFFQHGDDITTIGRSILGNKHIQQDISNKFSINQHFDIVVHAAGKAHFIPKTEQEADDFFKVNYEATCNLLYALRESLLPKVFVFISTVAVYGKSEGEGINELQTPCPKTPYGESKLMAEEKVSNWCEANKVRCFILRLPLVVGRNPPGNLGSIKRAISRGYYFKIKENQAKKSIVLASDVAQLITNVMDLNNSGIYNLTDGVHPRFNQIEEALEKRLNKKVKMILPLNFVKLLAIAGDLIGRIGISFPLDSDRLNKMCANLTFSSTKAEKEIHWRPSPVLPFIESHI